MKSIFIFIFYLINVFFSAQEKWSFLKNDDFQKEVVKSIRFLNETKIIPKEIKNKVIFITFDFDVILHKDQKEIIGVNYSTSIPMEYATLNSNGQFYTDFQNRIHFFNFSENIVIIFIKGDRFINVNKMKKISNQIHIKNENILKFEFFKFIKGNNVTFDAVENFISLEKKDDKFVPVRVNTFDLKTFLKVWYGLEDIEEIPVGAKSSTNE